MKHRMHQREYEQTFEQMGKSSEIENKRENGQNKYETSNGSKQI